MVRDTPEGLAEGVAELAKAMRAAGFDGPFTLCAPPALAERLKCLDLPDVEAIVDDPEMMPGVLFSRAPEDE